MLVRLSLSILPFLFFVPQHNVWAQFDDNDPEVEALYDKFDTNEEKRSRSRRKQQRAARKRKIEKRISNVSDLSDLAPFNDVAVIQKRFLPKTKRFEISGHGKISTNNAFFNNFGAAVKFAYYFKEKHGVEFNYSFLGNSERDVTNSLESKQNIATKSLVQPDSYLGLAYKWQPLYGKMALFNRNIVPFDIYFSVGGGLTKTALGENEPTISLATGQLFALSKAWGFRWDFMWNFYTANVVTVDSGNTVESTSFHNDLFIMVGLSYFFPEATYR